jgi:hypothetical protein
MRFANQIAVGMLLAAFAAAPLPSAAATISSISIVKNGGNTADDLNDTGSVTDAVSSSVSVSGVTATSFDARYAAVVSTDHDGTGGPRSSTLDFDGDFSITFNVTATASVAWFLTIDLFRIGAQTIVSDGTGNASVDLGALTGSETGAGSVTSGSLSLAALTTLDNSGAPATSPDAPFNQSGVAVISGIGTGAAQSVNLNFVFTAAATTVDPAGGDFQGDEAALRMGMDSALSGFIADDYPGVGLRNINTDGIWVLFQLDEAPEPGTGLMLGLGLLGLGFRRRVRR